MQFAEMSKQRWVKRWASSWAFPGPGPQFTDEVRCVGWQLNLSLSLFIFSFPALFSLRFSRWPFSFLWLWVHVFSVHGAQGSSTCLRLYILSCRMRLLYGRCLRNNELCFFFDLDLKKFLIAMEISYPSLCLNVGKSCFDLSSLESCLTSFSLWSWGWGLALASTR